MPASKENGGWDRIRTYGAFSPPHFKCGALNHSATHPSRFYFTYPDIWQQNLGNYNRSVLFLIIL